jgi:hypothetical protein
MLPVAAKMFALVRDLSARRKMPEIQVSRWLVQRHNVGALAALAGVSELRDELVTATVRWGSLAREMPTIVERFRDADVGIVPIKGLAYAAGLYETPAARPMTDVDLLVEPGRDAHARQVLTRAGFELRNDVPLHHATMWERPGLTIDLHRSILSVGRSAIAIDEIWARTRPGWPAGARRLEPVDELIFHLAHMARNRLCGPLVHVVDAARLLERISDIADVHARARAWQIHAAIDVALAYCRAIIDDTQLPWLGPASEDALLVRQPRVARKLIFDVATAGSARQLAARVIGAGFQRFMRSS